MTHPTDGFESAAASVLGDPNAPASTNGGAPAAAGAPGAPLSGAELEKARRQKKATGQPRGRPASGGAAPSSGNARASYSGPVSSPEQPKPLPPPPPIDPARIEALFRDAVNPFLVKLGAEPFTDKETKDGAKVIAPLWDDYAAKAAAQGSSKIDPLWAAFWLWAVPVAGPRALQATLVIIARIKAKRAAAKGAGFDDATTAAENASRAGGEAPAPSTFRPADVPDPVGNIGRGQIALRTPGLA